MAPNKTMVDYDQPNSKGLRVSTYQNYEEILDRNKDNNLTNFTFYILFDKYKREEMEIRHVSSCDEQNKLPLLTSPIIVFFDKVHVKDVSVSPTSSRLNSLMSCL